MHGGGHHESQTLRKKFLLSYLKAPGLVGAVAPSSIFLAQSLGRQACGACYIIELGAGAGAITEYLQKSFPGIPLVVVEQDAEMAAALQRRFSSCSVVADSVQARPDLFQGIPEQTVVVSSLPFRSLPKEAAQKIIVLLKDFLLSSPKRRLVQYTYGQRVPFIASHADLVWKRQELILRNMPPAWVWTLQKSDAGESPVSADAATGLVCAKPGH
jgi:phosphatidylethanolamine/phosphatidyl-N-methylethanolamine N-methyltransferase